MCYNIKMEIEHYNKKVIVTEENNGVWGKTCSCCTNFKEYTEYTPRYVDGKYYLFSLCNSCKVKKTRKWRLDNRERSLFNCIKNRATRQGWEFDLEIEDIVFPDFCPILGIKIDKNSPSRVDTSPTVDRIDTNKGYTKDNTVICSWRANKLKSNGTFEEIEKIYLFMKDRLN